MPGNSEIAGGTPGATEEAFPSSPLDYTHPTRVLVDYADFLVPDVCSRLQNECGLTDREILKHLYSLADTVRYWAQVDFKIEDERTRDRIDRLQKIADLLKQLEPLVELEYGPTDWSFGAETGILLSRAALAGGYAVESLGVRVHGPAILAGLAALQRDARLRSDRGNQMFADIKSKGNNYRRRRDELWSDLLFKWAFHLRRNIGTGGDWDSGRSNSAAGKFLEIMSARVLSADEIGNVRKYLSSYARHFMDIPSAMRKLGMFEVF